MFTEKGTLQLTTWRTMGMTTPVVCTLSLYLIVI
ncbi:hypothetical protein LINPERHAP2_LOCUS41453 [Linum perenne]